MKGQSLLGVGEAGGEGHKVNLALLTLRLSRSPKGKNKNTSEERTLEHCPWVERLMSLGPFWMLNVSPETYLDLSPKVQPLLPQPSGAKGGPGFFPQ